MSKPNTKKQLSEESIEAKHRNTVIEPTTLKAEAKTFAKDAADKLWKDMLAGSGTSIAEQLFGSVDQQLSEGKAVSLKKNVQKPEEKAEKVQITSEHMEYFRTVNNVDRLAETKTESQISDAVDQIRMEIKRLIATSKIVENTVKDATADKAPVKPGKYHISFFEFVLSIIKDATRKLEDSVSYGSVLTGKKQQSKYWSSYKKHGTSFGLSSERSTATQTG